MQAGKSKRERRDERKRSRQRVTKMADRFDSMETTVVVVEHQEEEDG